MEGKEPTTGGGDDATCREKETIEEVRATEAEGKLRALEQENELWKEKNRLQDEEMMQREEFHKEKKKKEKELGELKKKEEVMLH